MSGRGAVVVVLFWVLFGFAAVGCGPDDAAVPATTDESLAPAASSTSSASSTATVASASSIDTTALPTTTALSLTTLEQRRDADLVVPLAGGDNIEPVVLMTIPVGGGEGEITPQNGEFTTPVAVFPTSLLVIEDAPFAGFSGRGLQFDRSGQWQQDLLIDGIGGSTPLWVEAAPNGVLFVAAIIDSPDDLHVRVSAHRLDGNTFRVLKTVDLPGLDDTAFELAPDGLVTGGTRIMEIETGAVAEDVAATVGIVDAAWVRVGVVRAASTGEHRWVIDAELDLASPPNTLSTRAGRFGNGAWYSGVTSNAPGMNSTFIALLATDEASTWYRFGAWDLAATDAEQLILTSITLGGLVVGTMNA